MKKQFLDEWVKRDFFIRESNPKGDLDVIDEVVTRDMYCMKAYANRHKAPSLILDVGAHVGSFCVLAKTLWPEVPIIAFEPNPDSFELLQANTSDLPGVICVNAAISYGERPDLVYVNSIRSTGSGFVIEREKALDAIRWKDAADHTGYNMGDFPFVWTTIEEHLGVETIPGILMKLDAELAEINLLNGLTPWLSTMISGIVGEYHCEGGWNEFLERVDFENYRHLSFEPVSADWTTPIGLFRAI